MSSPAQQYPSSDTSNIVKLKRMGTMLWKVTRTTSGSKMPTDVPPGHVAILIGEAYTRKVIRSDYLNLPIFSNLLEQAYEEYGHQQLGLLAFPCTEFIFSVIISKIEFTDGVLQEKLESPVWRDLMPLLQGCIAR